MMIKNIEIKKTLSIIIDKTDYYYSTINTEKKQEIINFLKLRNKRIIPKSGIKVLKKLSRKEETQCFCFFSSINLETLFSDMTCLCAKDDYNIEKKELILKINYKNKGIGVIKMEYEKKLFHIHNEIVSGLLLNTIYNKIHHFPFLYDIIDLPKRNYLSLIDTDCRCYKDAYDYKKLSKQCVVYEYIDGIDHHSFCVQEKDNFIGMMKVLFQGLLALDYVNKIFNFCHGDICA